MKRWILLIVAASFSFSWLAGQSRLIRPIGDKGDTPAQVVWDQRNAAHLMRRAGFSASPSEMETLLEQGFQATLDRLLNFEQIDDSVMEAGLAGQNYSLVRVNPNTDQPRADIGGMNQWWLYRMIHSRRQLLEKMTLFWHDHFATSAGEIRFVQPGDDGRPIMMEQHDILRRNALGNFKQMVQEIARDPAMIVWLDNHLNVKDNPNENWARELLELFTMGVDQYTEFDIQEAARAFTGWSIDLRRGEIEFVFRPDLHDFDLKSFMGRVGLYDGDDIIDIVFEQDVTARFIARKLWEFFVYPEPSDELIAQLAQTFREADYEIRPLMRAIFTHPDFFSDRAYRALMKSPVEMTVNFTREMELTDPYFLPFFLDQMNQVLFLPPDVGGWTNGVGWVNTSTLLFRYNFVNTLLVFRDGFVINRRPVEGIDLSGMIADFDLRDESEVVAHFVDRLLAGEATPDEKIVFEEYLLRGDDGLPAEFDIEDPLIVDKKVRGVTYLIALLPIYQLN